MSTIKFSDGMEFNTSDRSYRVVRKSDGYYIVGRGCLIPVDSSDEGYRMIDELLATEGHSSR
jgi:hypothetical protein